MSYKPYVIMAVSAATAFLLAVAAQKVLALPNPAWEAQKIQAEKYGDQETINKLKYLSTAGTLRYPDLEIYHDYAGTEYHQSCCGEADAYEADDFRLDKDGNLIAILTCNDPKNCEEIPGKIVRPQGSEWLIPSSQILVNHNPTNNTGHGWVWIAPNAFNQDGSPRIYCYAPPAAL